VFVDNHNNLKISQPFKSKLDHRALVEIQSKTVFTYTFGQYLGESRSMRTTQGIKVKAFLLKKK
jgi:hypothetical protein